MRRFDGPEAQRVDGLATVADHGPVIGNAGQRRRVAFNNAQCSVANLERDVQFHLNRFVGARHFPRIRPGEPVVGLFALPAIADALLENAILVAQAVAHARNAQRRHRIEETRREPAQAAIAEARIRFLLDDLERVNLQVLAQVLPGGINLEVCDVVRQRTTEQEFHREIIDSLGVALPVGVFGLEPALRKHVAHGAGDGFILVARCRFGVADHLVEGQMPLVKGIGVAGQADWPAVVTGEEGFFLHRFGLRSWLSRACHKFFRWPRNTLRLAGSPWFFLRASGAGP